VLRKLLFHTLIGLLGLWAATKIIPGVTFAGSIGIFLFCGLILGFGNAFIKPVLKIVSLPLRIITLGLFNFVINMLILEGVDILFPELDIRGIIPLFLTSLLITVAAELLHYKENKN